MKTKFLPISAPFYFSFLFLYLELVFQILNFHSLNKGFFFLFLFSLTAGAIASCICSLFSERVNFILAAAVTGLFCIFFCAEQVYHAVFQKFLALFSMLGVADQALDFLDVIAKNTFGNLFGIVLLILPFPLLFIGYRLHWFTFAQKPVKICGICLGTGIGFYLSALLILTIGNHSPYSLYDIYFHNVSTDMTLEYFGVLPMNGLDGWYAVAGKPAKAIQTSAQPSEDSSESEAEKVPEEPEIDTSPNILNIDFQAITASAPNENVVQLTEYFQSQRSTNKNEYTGMFQDYNVIFITAEGFSRFIIDEQRTPTLCKLKNEGFVFNHYYTPGWYASTSDGEYANLTGLLPTDGIVSMKRTGINQNNMYFTLGRQLERKGYTLNAYHNNSYTYYGRDLSHPNMGYNWHGTGNWFVPETNEYGTELWPQSDLQLMEQSMDEYMDSEPFHTYYMSVSGHMLYTINGNQMSARNYESVKDLPYSETTKCYLSCQLELEKALTALVETLEAKGLADHTVIVISPDHVPYDDKAVCDELAGHELESAIEWYQNDLIIWSGSMEEPITVDKYCYSVDILPTISNLLGLEYDSRLMLGQDILSDAKQLVCFPDRSFISGKCIYNASNGSVTPLTDEPVTQEYLDQLSVTVYNKFVVSEMILNEDYYKYLQFQ